MRWPLLRAVVSGDSMLPVLCPGDRVLVRRGRALAWGALVVAEHPRRPKILVVKRLAGRPGDDVYGAPLGADDYWLASDNLLAAPDDSRSFGPVAASAIVGRVVLRYRPLARSRRKGTASARVSKT